MHLVDLESVVKPYLAVTSNAKDGFLDQMLSFVDNRIKNLCNQSIFQTSNTLQFTGNGYNYKVIPNFPILSITSLSYASNSSLPFVWAPVTTPYSLVITNSETGVGRCFFPAGFASGWYNYQLIYVYGYNVTEPSQLPGTIQNVALEMCDILYKNSNILGVGGARLGLNSISFSENMSNSTAFRNMEPEWRRKLKPYAKWSKT